MVLSLLEDICVSEFNFELCTVFHVSLILGVGAFSVFQFLYVMVEWNLKEEMRGLN